MDPNQTIQNAPPAQMQAVPVPTPIITKVCKVCRYVVQDSWYFCPNCGKKLKMKPLSTSFWRQMWVYCISIFVPPFGIFPAINYLRQKDTNARLVGIACLLLTVLSLAVSTWYTIYLVQQIQTELNNQLQTIQGLTY